MVAQNKLEYPNKQYCKSKFHHCLLITQSEHLSKSLFHKEDNKTHFVIQINVSSSIII